MTKELVSELAQAAADRIWDEKNITDIPKENWYNRDMELNAASVPPLHQPFFIRTLDALLEDMIRESGWDPYDTVTI